jgi:hypothetical protein
MRRELNEIEYLHWCIGQPFNVVLAVQLRGDLSPERLRAALDKAQRRHPLLQVNTEIGPTGLPWFSSDGVGAIPVSVVEQSDPDRVQRLAESELDTGFVRDAAGSARPPLIRVALLRPRDPAQPTGIVVTAQHVIADGLSMVFLFRDLLRFIDEPDAAVTILDAPASPEDLLPPAARRRVPKSPRLFQAALWLVRIYARLRFGRRLPGASHHTQHHRRWTLTREQTDRLRARCRREGVSIQSAVCAAFLPDFSAIHTPVNLRPFLARPVGESVGVFVGSADLKMRCRAARGFWENARRFHRRLRRSMRAPFRMFRVFSKAVAPAAVQELGRLLFPIAGKGRPFAVTNLGALDGAGIQLRGRSLRVESFFGGTTSVVDSSVLTVYTIDGQMHLHLLASEADNASSSVRDDSAWAVQRLLDAPD